VDGINTWFASKAARELGLKAVVSGLGGDELFAGYPSFRDIPRWVRWGSLPSHIPFLGESIRRLIAGSRHLHPKTAGLVKYAGSYAGAYLLRRGLFMPWELGTVMDRDFMAEGIRRLDPLRFIAASAGPLPRTAIGKVVSFEACIYLRNQLLRDTDWAGMAHSLEVRVPFVDRRLLSEIAPLVMSLPPGGGKRLLAASPRQPLPDAAVDRKKTGFETPIKDWLQRDGRTQAWRRVPELARTGCPWARRWAYQLATLAENHAVA
jgi:asparagine synthase (glutamine-hydrolysing)